MNEEDKCMTCDGRGFTFEQIDESHRRQVTCKGCLGTGRHDVSLARTLSGEAKEDPDPPPISPDDWKRFLANS